MNIFVNCNNLTAFREFVKTYSSENKKHHFIFGRQDIGLLNRKGLVFGSDEELIEILKLNDINDYEIIHATEVNAKVPIEWKTKIYNQCCNMLLQYLAPWYIKKYISTEPLLCLEEDFIVAVNIDEMFRKMGPGNRAIFSTLSMSRCGYGSKEAEAFMEMIGAKDYFTDIYYKKIVGCPRYYETYDVQENEKYIIKFYKSEKLYDVIKKSKVWHAGYLDEKFHSYSPNNFIPFGTKAKWVIIGEKSVETANYQSIARNINTTLMHIGGLYKMKVLENIMEAYNGNIQ